MAWQVPADPYSFDSARGWFRDRLPVTDAEYAKLTIDARRKAFKVAGVLQADVVTDVWTAIDDAIADGTTIDDFRAAITDSLTAAWGGPNPARLDTIWRTNLQTAYQAGRQAEMADPDIAADRPYLRFVATLDGRTTAICRPLHNTVLPASDPFWGSRQPPLHFSCRSTTVTLSPDEAAELGLTKDPPSVTAAKGFGNPLIEWNPDLVDYPAPIASTLAANLAMDAAAIDNARKK
jgi:SPP1 gp7 family putative phage head morphogenesis protein